MKIIRPKAVIEATGLSRTTIWRLERKGAFPKRLRGRSFGFIGAAAFALILGSSLGLGLLFDAMAHSTVFMGINIAITAMAALLIYAGRKLRHKKKPAKK